MATRMCNRRNARGRVRATSHGRRTRVASAGRRLISMASHRNLDVVRHVAVIARTVIRHHHVQGFLGGGVHAARATARLQPARHRQRAAGAAARAVVEGRGRRKGGVADDCAATD